MLVGSPLGCFLALRGIDQSKGLGLGTARSSQLMQCHPEFAVLPDGLPAVRRLFNIYHPYDAVAYRLEPLAYAPSELEKHKTAFVEFYGGGKRLHIAAQELGDSVSKTASRLGSTIAGAFRRSMKSDKNTTTTTTSNAQAVGGHEDTSAHGGGGSSAVVAVETGTTTKHYELGNQTKSAADGASPMDIDFGRPESTSAVPSPPPLSTTPSSAIARVAGGHLPSAGGWASVAAGHIDFSLQENSLENQYLSALSAHFLYWSSMDVAQFVYRAVKGLDVVSGKRLPLDGGGVGSLATSPRVGGRQERQHGGAVSGGDAMAVDQQHGQLAAHF